jgi:hypothetical protein
MHQKTEVAEWLRAIAVVSPNHRSRNTRPVAWWTERARAFYGPHVTESDVRGAIAALKFTRANADGSTNILARESLRRACVVFPDRYRYDPGSDKVIEKPASEGGTP